MLISAGMPASGERKGGDGEGEAERLHQLFLFKVERLEIRHCRHHEHARCPGHGAGGEPDRGRQPPGPPRGHAQLARKQGVGGTGGERDAER